MSVKRIPEPTEDDNTDCHLQQQQPGGTLICQTVTQGKYKVNRTICFNCEVGKIFRETNCKAVRPKKLRIIKVPDQWSALRKDSQLSTHHYPIIKSMYCTHHERETTLDFCRTCEDIKD